MRWIDNAIKEEEEIQRDKRETQEEEDTAREEFEENERAFQDYVNGTAEWLAQKRAEEVEEARQSKAATEAREAADRRMAEWVARQEQQEAEARARRKKAEEEEVQHLNAAFQAAKYRDWEAGWSCMNHPRMGLCRGPETVVEASVQQQGRPLAKKARWSHRWKWAKASPCTSRWAQWELRQVQGFPETQMGVMEVAESQHIVREFVRTMGVKMTVLEGLEVLVVKLYGKVGKMWRNMLLI